MLKIRPQVGKFYKRMIKKSREIACFLSKRLQKIEGSRSEDSSSSIDWITIGNIIGPLPMLAPATTLMMNVFSVFSRQEAKQPGKTEEKLPYWSTDESDIFC